MIADFDEDRTVIVSEDDPAFDLDLAITPEPARRESGPIVLLLRSTDHARRAMRRSALRYAAKILRRLGYLGAALALEIYVRSELEGAPAPLPTF